MQRTWTAGPLRPGTSFVVTIPLRWAGAGQPDTTDSGLSTPILSMLGALFGVPLLLLGVALIREMSVGRLDALRLDQVTPSWLQQNLLTTPAEVVGAMWDESVGASEVAATIARFVGEGKMQSRVNGDDLQLTLKVPRDSFHGYERELVDALFVKGDTTSTDTVRRHYKASGFDPATLITKGVQEAAEARLPKGTPVRVSGVIPVTLFLAAVVALVWVAIRYSDMRFPALIIGIVSVVLCGLACIAPTQWRKRKDLGVGTALLNLIPATILTVTAAYLIWRSAAVGAPPFPLEMQLALALLGLWTATSAITALRSRESRESIASRKMLTAAREFFRRELKKPNPSLDDAWYPYALAFGLGRDVDRWFAKFPGAGHSRSGAFTSSSGSSSSGSSSNPSWTGGGGAFGGAGASGAWAAAATGLAAGVAAPSSSGSSGGGGGGGGGSSGGGGGGGW